MDVTIVCADLADSPHSQHIQLGESNRKREPMSHRLLKNESWRALLALLAVCCLPAAAWAQAPFPVPVMLSETSSNNPTGPAGAPYDLTPFEADMILAFDNNGIARPEWPRPPVHDDTPCIVAAGNEASLNTCLDRPGEHIIIPAGDYTGPFTFDRSDQWIDMDNGAILRGGITMAGGADRVQITGGNFIRGSVQNAGVDDLLIKNVNMFLIDLETPNRNVFLTCVTGFNCARMAIVNTTCHATTACALTNHQPKGSSTSLIIANYDAWSEFVNGTGNDEYVSRLQNTDRVMIVDSHFRVYPTGKPSQRFHYGSTATLIANNIFESSGTGFTNFWIDTTAGGAELDDIDNMFILRNDFYQHDSSKTSDISIDDSVAGNGIDVVLVHLEGNVSYHANTASFTIGGSWNGIGQNCGGRVPCLRNINNTGRIVPGLTPIPFNAGADHSTQSAPTPSATAPAPTPEPTPTPTPPPSSTAVASCS